MKDFALTAFAGAVVLSTALILGGGGAIAGVVISGSTGAFAKFAAIAVGGAIGFGITAGIAQIKLKDKTLMEHIL